MKELYGYFMDIANSHLGLSVEPLSNRPRFGHTNPTDCLLLGISEASTSRLATVNMLDLNIWKA